jgi:hypothetical protein
MNGRSDDRHRSLYGDQRYFSKVMTELDGCGFKLWHEDA